MKPNDIKNLIIIGSGPAGYTAAVYAARAGLAPLVFEGAVYGGALMTTTEVENYPGFKDGIMGPELMQQMRDQAIRFGADLAGQDAEALDLTGSTKYVTAGGHRYAAKAVILAMGAATRYLNVPGEQELLGHGVSACATCDGFFFRGQDVAVIGGGDSAMEEALFLTRFASSVTIIHRRAEFKASKIMLKRTQANPKITWRIHTQVAQVLGGGKVTGLKLHDTQTNQVSELPVAGVFMAIGHDPRSQLVHGQVNTDEAGYVQVQPGSTHTNLAGVFAAGDLVDHTYRQAVTAAGSGCAAAIDAERWLAAHPAQ